MSALQSRAMRYRSPLRRTCRGARQHPRGAFKVRCLNHRESPNNHNTEQHLHTSQYCPSARKRYFDPSPKARQAEGTIVKPAPYCTSHYSSENFLANCPAPNIICSQRLPSPQPKWIPHWQVNFGHCVVISLVCCESSEVLMDPLHPWY